MKSKYRWQKAQQYEQSYWEKLAERIAEGSTKQLTWYGWKAAEMEKRLEGFIPGAENTLKILEVGSGPIGIASFLKWGDRYTIDPLEDFYKNSQSLTLLRDSTVHYGKGTGEDLPFPDGLFSLVILDNVIDHVHAADRVLKEAGRVLSKNGSLYLAVNVHTNWGALLHSVLSKLHIDKGHPYTFTPNSIRDFIGKCGFMIQLESINDYLQARTQDRNSSYLKDKVKGFTGLSEFIYYAVCSK